MFGRWGRFVYRHRLATLIGSGAVLVASVVFLVMGGTLTSGGPLTSNLEAARAGKLVSSDLGHETTTVPKTSSFDLIFKSGTVPVSDPRFKDAVATALAPIQSDSRIVSLLTSIWMRFSPPPRKLMSRWRSTPIRIALIWMTFTRAEHENLG